MEVTSNGNSSHEYHIRIDDEIPFFNLWNVCLPQVDYIIIGINRFSRAGAGATSGQIRPFRPELFLPSAFDMIRDMFSLSPNPLPPTIADGIAREVADYATDAAQRHDFTASRLLPINVGISTFPFDTSSDDHGDQPVERAVRESLSAFRTEPATKSSVEALEEVKSTLECQHSCVICMEDLLPNTSGPLGSKRDDDDHDDDNDHRKVLKLPCSHLFHKDCIVQWFKINHLCPLCRNAMPT